MSCSRLAKFIYDFIPSQKATKIASLTDESAFMAKGLMAVWKMVTFS